MTSMKRLMTVDEAKGVCRDRSVWRSVLSIPLRIQVEASIYSTVTVYYFTKSTIATHAYFFVNTLYIFIFKILYNNELYKLRALIMEH